MACSLQHCQPLGNGASMGSPNTKLHDPDKCNYSPTKKEQLKRRIAKAKKAR